jgi:hypothetical protein
MALQGPSGPHELQANVNPLDRPEREDQETEDLGIAGPAGTALKLENEETE